MQQYYVDTNLLEEMVLSGSRFKYLVKVIRIKIDESIILFDGVGRSEYRVVDVDNDNASIILKKVKDLPHDNLPYSIDLGIGLLKKDKLEWVIQKTTELGIDNVYLLNLENNVVNFNGKVEKKLSRYEDILVSASEQSKRLTVPKIYYLDTLDDIDYEKYDMIFLAHEKIEKINFLKELDIMNDQMKILLLIGPEGGFSEHEIQRFESLDNVHLVSLGKNILRAETAAVSAVAMARMKLEDLYENSSL